MEAPTYLGFAVLVLYFSYTGRSAIRSARLLSMELAAQVSQSVFHSSMRVPNAPFSSPLYCEQAAQTQALLEAAMPPAIARALLDDKPAGELTCSYPSATIAFFELDDFADKVGYPRASTRSLLLAIVASYVRAG